MNVQILYTNGAYHKFEPPCFGFLGRCDWKGLLFTEQSDVDYIKEHDIVVASMVENRIHPNPERLRSELCNGYDEDDEDGGDCNELEPESFEIDSYGSVEAIVFRKDLDTETPFIQQMFNNSSVALWDFILGIPMYRRIITEPDGQSIVNGNVVHVCLAILPSEFTVMLLMGLRQIFEREYRRATLPDMVEMVQFGFKPIVAMMLRCVYQAYPNLNGRGTGMIGESSTMPKSFFQTEEDPVKYAIDNGLVLNKTIPELGGYLTHIQEAFGKTEAFRSEGTVQVTGCFRQFSVPAVDLTALLDFIVKAD